MVLIPFLDQSLEAVAQQQQNTQMQTTFNKLFPQKKQLKQLSEQLLKQFPTSKEYVACFFGVPITGGFETI